MIYLEEPKRRAAGATNAPAPGQSVKEIDMDSITPHSTPLHLDCKQCSKCEQWLPFDKFYRRSASKDGLASSCRECSNSYPSRAPEALRAARRDYIKRYPEREAEARRRHKAKNPERFLLMQREREKRRVRDKDVMAQRVKEWILKHPEKRREYRQKYLQEEENRAKLSEAVRRCRKAKPAKYLSYTHARRTRVKGNGGNYTAQEWSALCEQTGNICLCCKKQAPLVVDHVIPVTKGGTSNIDNLQPLCKSCNSRKHNKIIDYRRTTNPRVEVTICPAVKP